MKDVVLTNYNSMLAKTLENCRKTMGIAGFYGSPNSKNSAYRRENPLNTNSLPRSPREMLITSYNLGLFSTPVNSIIMYPIMSKFSKDVESLVGVGRLNSLLSHLG